MLGGHKASAATALPRDGAKQLSIETWDWCQDPRGSQTVASGRVGTRGAGRGTGCSAEPGRRGALLPTFFLPRLRNSANRHPVVEAC